MIRRVRLSTAEQSQAKRAVAAMQPEVGRQFRLAFDLTDYRAHLNGQIVEAIEAWQESRTRHYPSRRRVMVSAPTWALPLLVEASELAPVDPKALH